MANQKSYPVVIIAGLVLAGGVAWLIIAKPFIPEKTKLARYISQAGYYKSGVTGLLTFETDFLKAWKQGIKDGKSTFAYNGSEYNTVGGTHV